MNRISNTLPLIVLAGLFIAAYCSPPGQAGVKAPEPKEVRLTERQGACGSGVGLNVGDTLELVLDANPTGYAWEIGFNAPSVLKITGQPSLDPDSRIGGAGGEDTFHFTAIAEGEERLRLVYRAGTDTSAWPARTCEVNIVVTE